MPCNPLQNFQQHDTGRHNLCTPAEEKQRIVPCLQNLTPEGNFVHAGSFAFSNRHPLERNESWWHSDPRQLDQGHRNVGL